jgi:FkbM family methyltransferase
MNYKLRARLREIYESIGFGVIPWNIRSISSWRTRRALEHFAIGTVLDVGANQGGFGVWLREIGFRGRIVSVEPLEQEHRLLLSRSRRDPDWFVLPPYAIGDSNGHVQIRRASNSESSSLLEFSSEHRAANPEVTFISDETVELTTVERLLESHGDLIAGAIALKLDIQGLELPALRGCGEALSSFKLVYVEISITPMYDGEADYLEVAGFLASKRFKLWNATPVMVDEQTGSVRQWNMLFAHEEDRS